ncbi:MAG: ABC transporter permease [Anaerolineales bacterium]|nr:ABC transporter permease [Anaerolineales bacterium]
MTKFWHVFRHEYSRHVFQKRYLLGLLSVPIFIVFMIVLVFIMVALETNTTPIGYIDQSGFLADPLPAPTPSFPDRPVPMQPFDSEQPAQAALQAGDIQAYYVLAEDYLTSGQAQVVYLREPRSPARSQFYDFLAVNLLASQPPEVSSRILEGNNLVIRASASGQEASEERWFTILMPIFLGIAFVAAVGTSSGYLLQAVVEEKENCTMEIIVTSVSPGQLMAGKIAGDISIGLTQLLGWAGFVIMVIILGRDRLAPLKAIDLPLDLLALAVALIIPAFVMNAAIMAALGATVTDSREGQQISGLFMIPNWIPYILMFLIMESPNSPVVVGMSLFPLTAPLTMIMRAGYTVIPPWQIAVSIGGLALSAAGAIWLAGRAFRLGMLRYGQRLRFNELFARGGSKA